MSAIKLPVRDDREDGVIVDASGDSVCVVFHENGMHSPMSARESRDCRAAQIVAALNRPDLAPALAALEAVAREALRDANAMLRQRKTDGDAVSVEAWQETIDRIKAALALAGATLDGKDAKP